MFTCTGTDSQPSELWTFAATSSTKVGGTQNKTKNTPMTLKSFYSRNHRLPSPWIRAVTPAPACLPPWLPKLPAGRQTGEAAQLLPERAREGKGQVGEVRCYTQAHSGPQPGRVKLRKTDWQTVIQREKGTQTPATKERHRPLPARLRYAHSQVHTHFLIQTHHSERQALPDLQAHTKHRYTHITNIQATKFQA